MTRMPVLETERLLVRPFTLDDLDVIHRVLDVELVDADTGSGGALSREERARWLAWTVLGYDQLAWLYQPPYGERAVALRGSGEVIGAVGLVPCLAPFAQIPALRGAGAGGGGEGARGYTAEVGLYYAISPAQRRRGYAAEAAGALVRYALGEMRVARVVATTARDNIASVAVMRRLGMTVEENPLPEPPWLQVVAWLTAWRHTHLRAGSSVTPQDPRSIRPARSRSWAAIDGRGEGSQGGGEDGEREAEVRRWNGGRE